jgi:hypothetical protein
VEYFDLDAIISVCYRVNSKRGTQFRIWATRLLHQHILEGYTVNSNRLRDLIRAVCLISEVVERRDLSGDDAKALLRVVGEYGRSLDLLDDYDHQRISAPKISGRKIPVHMIDYAEALRITERLRDRFGASSAFGMERTTACKAFSEPFCKA